MSPTQKIIKYAALAFGIFLAVSIISGIIYGIYSLGEALFGESDKLDEAVELYSGDNPAFKELSLKINATEIVIKTGDKLTVSTDSKTIKATEEDDCLTIKDSGKKHIVGNIDTNLTITIPEDYEFEKVKIDSGAGAVYISRLTTDTLDFDIGAGKTTMEEVTVKKKTQIDTGAGSVEITKSSFHDLDLDLGAGKFTFEGTITGESEVDCGVGSSTFKLTGKKDDYKLKLEKGVGSIKYDNESVSNGTYGDGENYIDIDGGVGSININFTE